MLGVIGGRRRRGRQRMRWLDGITDSMDVLIKELQQHVKNVTAPYKYPRIVEFVDELPKTISGKIRRVEIRKKDAEK